MCYKIESSFILIHGLKNKTKFTFRELVLKKRSIESNNPSVFVDISRESILRTVESYPEIFNYSENIISKQENSEKYFSAPLIDFFGFDIEDGIKSEITQILDCE